MTLWDYDAPKLQARYVRFAEPVGTRQRHRCSRAAGRSTDQNREPTMRLQPVEPTTQGRLAVFGDGTVDDTWQRADLQIIECVAERIDLRNERKRSPIAIAGRLILDVVDQKRV